MLYYGKSGIGKTANLKMLAKWFYEKYKLKIRMIHCDGGGYRPFFDSDNLIGKGIVEVFDNTNREFALADIHRLADGNWPNAKGDLERDANNENKAYLAKQLAKNEIGAYFIEGVTSLSETLLSHFSDKLTEGPVGFKASYLYQEQEYILGGMDKGHYGIIQRELHKLIVKHFGQLPVKLIVWTAKPRLAIDKDSGGEPLLGPEGAGNADTQKLPGWFENCLHFDKFAARIQRADKSIDTQEIRVAWFQEHNIEVFINGAPVQGRALAKSSCPAERYEEMLQGFPGGYVRLGFQRGIDKYIEFLEGLDIK
jgi:hypothetical protein